MVGVFFYTYYMKDDKQKPYKKVKREDMEIPGNPMAVKVVNNQIELALKVWKQKVKSSGKIDELKERQEYIKPTTAKRKKMQRARRTEWVRRQMEI